jgi:two-component system sensor histidine kinase UhpB
VSLRSRLALLLLGRWLQPTDHIVKGLQEIGKGDLSKRIHLTGLQELDLIISNINQLTEVLGARAAEHERLQSLAISRSEEERRQLALELHDSLGQSLSAIKAVSVSIGMRTRAQLPDIADSAQHIELISDTAYTAVRNLMSALRPSVLDELGLKAALQQMVDDWNHVHYSTFCRLRLDCELDDLDGEQAINIYCIVQESLNNIARHAEASEAGIAVSGHEVLTLTIVDNGIGFDPDQVKQGVGLWNIRDRVNLLHGKFQLAASPGNGLRLFMEFPRKLDQRNRTHDR